MRAREPASFWRENVIAVIFLLRVLARIRCLSSDVFERRTSTGREPFSLLICLDATKFVLLSVFTLKEKICLKSCSKSRLKSAVSQLPVYMGRSKTSLLKLHNVVVTETSYQLIEVLSFCDRERA